MTPENITVRETLPADLDTIVRVQKAAFGCETEAELTADLLSDASAGPLVSLLAFHDQEAVGHILFTRCRIEGSDRTGSDCYILAPLAVIPAFQKQGIGGMLIAKGSQLLRERGAKLVFVLGHREYYPRHGFLPDAGAKGYPPPYPIPEKDADCWMVQPLTQAGFTDPKGRVICADTLDRPELWRE